jgi:hypothetical protein
MFRKFLLLAAFLSAQICLMPDSLTAGSFTNYIANACPEESHRYKNTVTEFAIRMKPSVEKCGCGAVGLYYALNESSMELIAQLEEDTELMRSAAKLFTISEEVTEALRNVPEIAETLTVTSGHDPLFFQRLSDALASFSRSDRSETENNPNYILYYLLAAAVTDETASKSETESVMKAARPVQKAKPVSLGKERKKRFPFKKKADKGSGRVPDDETGGLF